MIFIVITKYDSGYTRYQAGEDNGNRMETLVEEDPEKMAKGVDMER